MIQSKINKAYQPLLSLVGMKLPIKKARLVYMMVKEVEQHFQFAVQEEKKLLNEFGGTVHEDGRVSFETPDDYIAFQERLIELGDSDVEFDISPIIINEADLGNQVISASDILALEGFVLFED